MQHKFSRVAIIGLGYIGLPTAATLASRGVEGIGVDVNEHAVSMITQGKVHFSEPDLDMLVRAAAPRGAVGRTFGIVTSGFNIGGMIGPLMFGYIMDHGAPRWVFGVSVIVMIVTAAVALIGDRRMARQRHPAAAPAE